MVRNYVYTSCFVLIGNTQSSSSALPTTSKFNKRLFSTFSLSLSLLAVTPSSGGADGAVPSIPLVAVITPTVMAFVLFTCLIIVMILFYLNQ